MDKDRNEGTEKHSKVTVKETVIEKTDGPQTSVGSDKTDGKTHHTVKKATFKRDL